MPDNPATVTPPANPPVTPPTPEPEKLKVNPYVEGLLSSFGKILEPEPVKKDEPPPPMVSLGEMNALIVSKKAETDKQPDKPAEPPVATPPATHDKPVVPDKPADPPVAPAAKPAVVVKKKEPEPVVVPPVVTPSPVVTQPGEQDADAAAAEALKREEEEYVKGLSPEQQEELQVAQYAEKTGKTGLRSKLIEYYKKFDQFLSENPDEDVESGKVKEFIKDTRPAWSSVEYKRAERSMIADEARNEVKKELEPVVQQQAQRLVEIEARPAINRMVNEVEASIVAQQAEGAEPVIEPGVVKALKEKGYVEAVKDYPIEAPIVQGTLAATKAWGELNSRVRKYDPTSETDMWLMTFLSERGREMKQQPKSVQTLSDGRTFLPLNEYHTAKRADPAADKKYWTFGDTAPDAIKVEHLLTSNAILEVESQVNSLAKAGFVRSKPAREPKVLPNPTTSTNPPVVQTPPPNTPLPASPKVMGNPGPGAAEGGVRLSERAQFLENLLPGASEIVGTK